MVRQLLRREMRVEHQHGRPAREIRKRLVVLRIAELVIGRVDEVAVGPLDPVRERAPRMIQVERGHVEIRNRQHARLHHRHLRLVREVLIRTGKNGDLNIVSSHDGSCDSSVGVKIVSAQPG